MPKPQFYNVHLNDKHIDTTNQSPKVWVSRHVTATHMGEWFNHLEYREYATTIGAYYKFYKVQDTRPILEARKAAASAALRDQGYIPTTTKQD